MSKRGENSDVQRELRRLDVRPNKRRGQNFLIDTAVIHDLIAFAQIAPGVPVVEIGPGLGAMSCEIWRVTRRAVFVEIDETLAAELQTKLPEIDPRQIWCRDIRQTDARELAAQLGCKKFSVISNVPYSVSTDVMLWALSNWELIDTASFLLQREFAERVAAAPGGRDYGSLTVLRSLFADAKLGVTVGGGAFFPAAKVESRAVRFEMLERPRMAIADAVHFEKVVRSAFGQRRKTLLNSLSNSGLVTKPELVKILERLKIDGSRRAETLTLEEFVRLSECLREGD